MSGRRGTDSPRAGVLPRPLAAAVAALALIVGQLVSVGHHALVAHYVCQTHGTLHHGAPAPVAAAPALDEAAAVVRGAAATDHGVHDVCAFPAREDPAGPALGAALDLPGADMTAALARVSAARARPALPLLTLAPKQSPPAAS